MEHSLRIENGHSIIAFEGDVDLEHSRAARDILLKVVAENNPVLVDLSAVSYIDSSGIATLVESFQSARASGTKFALVAVSETALRVLQLARLDKVFTIHDSLEDALADES